MRKQTTDAESVTHTVLAAAAGVTDPLPTVDPPSPPAGYVPPSKVGRSPRPQRAQLQLAPRVATELHNATSYVQQFGDAAPDPGGLASSLTLARAWSDKLQLASAWYKYVQQQEHLAWKHAMGLMGELKVPFDFRAARDPSVATEFPSTAAFLAESSDRSKRAAATRAKNDKAAVKKAKEQVQPPPTQPPAGNGGAAPVSDPVKAAVVKLLN
jgi:hypothetical protein